MLNCKPQKLVKYWKYSTNEEDENQVEIITDTGNYLALSDQYFFIWKMCDGFTTVKDMIAFFEEIFKDSHNEKIESFVIKSLEEMQNNKLLVINWSPFG